MTLSEVVVIFMLVTFFSLTTFLSAASVDICDSNLIQERLAKEGLVFVQTPSGSEKDCKPSFPVPAKSTLDISIRSNYVPKRTLGGPEHHCIKIKFGSASKTLDCSPDGSGIFSMTAFVKVIYRSPVRDVDTQAVVEIPTWQTDFTIFLEIRPAIPPAPAFDSSKTKVLVADEMATISCNHPNSRLLPAIYHDGQMSKDGDTRLHILKVAPKDSGLYSCDYGDKKDNKVDAVNSIQSVIVADRTLMTSHERIVNATIGDEFPLFCSAKFYFGKIKPPSPLPSWLSLSRLSWIDLRDIDSPSLMTSSAENISIDVAVSPGVVTVSKIVDVLIEKADAGKVLIFRCQYSDEDGVIAGAILSTNIFINVLSLPTAAPLIDLSTTQIVAIVIGLVILILLIAGIVWCCLRGFGGHGKNTLRGDNPLQTQTSWTLQTQSAPFLESAPSPSTPPAIGVLYQPQGQQPFGSDARPMDPSNGEIFFGANYSSPPALPSPNANGAPYGVSPTSTFFRPRPSITKRDDDEEESVANDTYGVVLTPNHNNNNNGVVT